MKLTGYNAIRFAEETETTLKKYADPTEDAWDDCTPEQALRVAREDPSLIYCDAGALLVIDPVTDESETADEVQIQMFGASNGFGPQVTIDDKSLIRSLYNDPSATSWGEGSYVVGL